MVADDPVSPGSPLASVLDSRLFQFWAAGFTKRDLTPELLGKGVTANLETPSEETPSLSPFPLKNRIPGPTGKSTYSLILKE